MPWLIRHNPQYITYLMEWLIELDKELLLYLNSFHNSFFDWLMYTVSAKETWYPLYVIIIGALFYKQKPKYALMALGAVLLTVLIADQGSVKLFKEVFCRLRPSRDPELSGLVHLVKGYTGGKYGFVSSHAANTFGLAMITSLYFNKKWFTWSMFIWAAVVSYSRIYLGVHYPGDIIGGALLGCLGGYVSYKLLTFCSKRFSILPRKKETNKQNTNNI